MSTLNTPPSYTLPCGPGRVADQRNILSPAGPSLIAPRSSFLRSAISRCIRFRVVCGRVFGVCGGSDQRENTHRICWRHRQYFQKIFDVEGDGGLRTRRKETSHRCFRLQARVRRPRVTVGTMATLGCLHNPLTRLGHGWNLSLFLLHSDHPQRRQLEDDTSNTSLSSLYLYFQTYIFTRKLAIRFKI